MNNNTSISYKGINFYDYEVFNNYLLGDLNQLAAQKAATELQDLTNNIPLTPGTTPSCAYLEAYLAKYGTLYTSS